MTDRTIKRFDTLLYICTGFTFGLAMMVLGDAININTVLKGKPASAQSTQAICPEGSYNIGIEKNGEAICKLEPTGCPYGDSIPMDMCDKFAPQEPVGTTEKQDTIKQHGEAFDQPVTDTCGK